MIKTIADLHTHTFLSDGVLSPCELIHRAFLNGYQVIGLTDHVGLGTMERVLAELREERRLAEKYWAIKILVGVELTHVPAAAISELAKRAKDLGADLVVVHGETLVEPVEPGTNRAAVSCPEVDVLAHPGLLTEEEARLAVENGVFLELSSRRGHCLANGHVAALARKTGAHLLINSDGHQPSDLLTWEFVSRVGRGAGLDAAELEQVMCENPQKLLRKIKGCAKD
ncbi:histidinol phosphate phosphatase domain-containing protein [Capillibacterium thermochitinicola]|uniref:Histidinol phosphate phosphatase domain-containing protein n=1 Tax=Capillibacterium thermochitinicola TaxID=2699427 RepID=A0A8J6LN00_9FIRM|nr:histidinol phosphate phosphatase domain-containing protein [Capillibacterium thermochitinicola]MBA2133413.1 histidinol phosphate phosphatase domain-containing protein [Capillibacterium thermochitinicola]